MPDPAASAAGPVVRTSTDRILVTHVGSLPRPRNIVDLLARKEAGEPVDRSAFGLDWNVPLPSGEPALAQDVTLDAELGFIKD